MLLACKTSSFRDQNLCFWNVKLMLLQKKNIVLGSFRGINNIQNPPLNLQKTNYQRYT